MTSLLDKMQRHLLAMKSAREEADSLKQRAVDILSARSHEDYEPAADELFGTRECVVWYDGDDKRFEASSDEDSVGPEEAACNPEDVD